MDSQRKAPRWLRHLHFEADGRFSGEVLDLSAVGLRVHVEVRGPVFAGEALIPATITFENDAHVHIKVRVARVTLQGATAELGLEIAEADKVFYDALPRLQKGSGENPLPPDQ